MVEAGLDDGAAETNSVRVSLERDDHAELATGDGAPAGRDDARTLIDRRSDGAFVRMSRKSVEKRPVRTAKQGMDGLRRTAFLDLAVTCGLVVRAGLIFS